MRPQPVAQNELSSHVPGQLVPGALMGALDAHTTMSTQALNSEAVRFGIKDILLNYAGLYEALRKKSAG
jgi:hypothetical protein